MRICSHRKWPVKYMVAAALASYCLSPALAQTYHPYNDYGARDVRGGASIVIPFGGNKKNANSKPHIEFSFQQSRVQQNPLKFDFNRYSLQDAPIASCLLYTSPSPRDRG